MKIIADKNMRLLDETFGRHGDLQQLDGRGIDRNDLMNADVLLVRSVTRVDQRLLEGTAIRFVGSATIGIDHLDTDWLEANDISWAHAPGCNADSAAQYALAMMWLACDRLRQDFRQQRVGIIGRGNVGRRLEHLLKVLEIPVLACDPPLQESGVKGLVSMREACDNSIISMHVPLTRTGRHPTENLLNQEQLQTLNDGTLLVNTARGGVINRTSLLAELQSGRLHAALDVWPDEPFIGQDWLNATCVATPHVAGYSFEGKRAGTEMIYQAFCRTFAFEATGRTFARTEDVSLNFTPPITADEVLKQVIESSCPVGRDDATLRATPRLQADNERIQIDALRANYPVRREFKSHRVPARPMDEAERLGKMGFKTV